MEIRAFGRTGISLSVLGFGCGAVGGLMVRGEPADQKRKRVDREGWPSALALSYR